MRKIGLRKTVPAATPLKSGALVSIYYAGGKPHSTSSETASWTVKYGEILWNAVQPSCPDFNWPPWYLNWCKPV